MAIRSKLGLALVLTAALTASPAPQFIATAADGPSAAHAQAHRNGNAVAPAYNSVGITDGRTLARGQLDAAGSSFDAATLAAAGYGPGARVTVNGVDLHMPRTRPGQKDNVSPSTVPTTIGLRGRGNAIAFLATTTSSARPINVTVHYTDRTELRTFVTTNTWTTATPDPLGIVQDAVRVNGRNTPTTATADPTTPYGIFGSGVAVDPRKTVRNIEVSGNGLAHIFDAKIATVVEPFGVDSRGGRTPQPDSCDPLVQGQGICDAQESGIFEKGDPSAHLRYTTKNGRLPQDTGAFYNEITPKSSAPGTYFMTNGWKGGYFGIQELEDSSKIAIFSIFGPAKGEVPDDRLTSKVLYTIPGGDLVIHGEYAGGPSVRIPFDWKLGRTYATMVTEQVDESNGHAKIVTAWLNRSPVGQRAQWVRLMTVRTERPSTDTGLSSLYSFVEDFVRDDTFQAGRARTAAYGNAYTWSRRQDRWIPLSKVSFTGQMSRLFTIQNDAFPTPDAPCKVTETVTGSSIPAEAARSHVNSIWDTTSPSCRAPGMIAPIRAVRAGAPLYRQETVATITATADGAALVIDGGPYADGEALRVTVDGTAVSTTVTAGDDGRLTKSRIALPRALAAGTHRLTVSGVASGLTGTTTVTVR